jgi:hypothetical protein
MSIETLEREVAELKLRVLQFEGKVSTPEIRPVAKPSAWDPSFARRRMPRSADSMVVVLDTNHFTELVRQSAAGLLLEQRARPC